MSQSRSKLVLSGLSASSAIGGAGHGNVNREQSRTADDSKAGRVSSEWGEQRKPTTKEQEIRLDVEVATAPYWQTPSPSNVSLMLHALDAFSGEKSTSPCEKQSKPGGFQAVFVNRLEEKHVCPLCRLALRQPVQTNCGHRLCRSCITTILRGTNPCCPLDQMPLTEVFLDNFCRHEVLKLLVKCNNYKQHCPWQGQLQKLEEHLNNCEMQLMVCSNQGCTAQFVRLSLSDHLETCIYKLENCEFCGEKIAKCNMKMHCQDDCLEMLKECPESCGTFVKRRELVNHRSTQCPEAVVDCQFYACGCQFKGKRQAVDKHCQQSERHHLELLSVAQRDQHSSVVALLRVADESLVSADWLCSHMAKLEQQAEKHRQAKAAEIKNLREQLDALPKGNCVNAGHGSRHSVAFLEPRTTAIEQNITTINRQLSEVQSQQVKILEESAYITGMQDDHDLRLLAAETASYDGSLLWKIPNFDKLMADARNGLKASHYSAPFYTSRHGYKVCARIYPYGDGAGRASHLSLFFVIMQGNHDALLSWPFKQRVTLAVLDQSPSANHLLETFLPDPQSSSFQRPTAGMNIASGCPRMVSLDALLSFRYGYTKNNTLFVKIKVDTTGLGSL